MSDVNQIIVYEEIDRERIEAHPELAKKYQQREYSKFRIADPMVYFLYGLDKDYDHAYVLIGQGHNSREWMSKEIKNGHSGNRYTTVIPVFISSSQVTLEWRNTTPLLYLEDLV